MPKCIKKNGRVRFGLGFGYGLLVRIYSVPGNGQAMISVVLDRDVAKSYQP